LIFAPMDAIAVTFDVDWAPDWAIDECRSLCEQYGRPATFFVTHESDLLRSLVADKTVEVGLHPNFLPKSTHGSETRSVLDHCLKLVPDARCMRTHSLVQSSPIFATILEHYPQIETDVSLFLPLHPGLQPIDLYLNGKRLTRLPYFWEDDVFAEWPNWEWEPIQPNSIPGLMIYDFHPLLVALNVRDLSPYRRLRQVANGKPYHTLLRSDVAPHRHLGPGARTFLEKLLATDGNFCTVSEIASAHRSR
jgi:hypothetical protein